MGRAWTVEYAGPDPSAGFWRAMGVGAGDGEAWVVGVASGPALIGTGGAGTPWSYVFYPANLQNMPLNGVKSFSHDEVVAVGWKDFWGCRYPHVARWDGSDWKQDGAILPRCDGRNELAAVDGVEMHDVWAVGGYGFPSMVSSGGASGSFLLGADFQPLVHHWDGTFWNYLRTDLPGDTGYLNGVVAVGPGEAWAVGSTTMAGNPAPDGLVLKLAGTTWDAVKGPTHDSTPTVLWDVDAVEGGERMWAVGEFGYPDGRGGIGIWNGDWTQQAILATPERSWLRGVAVVSADEVWACGAKMVDGVQQALLARFDGQQWAEVPTPPCGERSWLTGIDAGPDAVLWASGFYSDTVSSGYTKALVLKGV